MKYFSQSYSYFIQQKINNLVQALSPNEFCSDFASESTQKEAYDRYFDCLTDLCKVNLIMVLQSPVFSIQHKMWIDSDSLTIFP